MERFTDVEVIGGQAHYMPKFDMQNTSGFEKIVCRLSEIEDILGDTYDLDRLRELVEADKDGRCVVLPCKVGDTINAIRYAEGKGLYVISDTVTSVSWNKNGYTVRTKSKFYPIKEVDMYDFAPISQYPQALADFYIGSKEAAEAALAKEANHE